VGKRDESLGLDRQSKDNSSGALAKRERRKRESNGGISLARRALGGWWKRAKKRGRVGKRKTEGWQKKIGPKCVQDSGGVDWVALAKKGKPKKEDVT